jgi:hypothetical protein
MRTIDKRTWRFAILVILIPSFALAAWRQNSHSHGEKVMTGPDWSDLMTSMDRMHAAMTSTKPTGDSDADFVKLMLPHHQAATDMAKTQLIYGKDPQMRRLAQEIITDQQSEIQLMQLWLKQHGPEHKSSSQELNQAPAVHASGPHAKEH